MITAEPLSRNSRILSKSLSVESKSKAAVDSSRISTSGSLNNPLAIVIHALILRGKLPAGINGSISSSASSLNSSLALSCFSLSDKFLVINPSTPINKLSTTDASSATSTSWNTIATPRLRDSFGVEGCAPLIETFPESIGKTPAKTFARVLFPQPFPPIIACISPK